MTEPRSAMPRQYLVFAALFAGLVVVLGIGYFLFLRTDYAVLAQSMRPADAAAVVAELDKRGVSYKLRDGGTTILVPEGEADATRVAIAGSDVAARGQIGFELFNKSDMGLTNFAQKINYQRALQGELVRTIMLMDGVESARVHLGLPERTLFRGDRSEPSAAVTVSMKPGLAADPARVAGIQRLVAAAVPDLPEGKVVVLDAGGRVISATASAITGAAELDERQAVQAYYAARVRSAAEPRLAGQKFVVRVLLLSIGGAGIEAASGVEAQSWAPAGDGAARNFRLRVLLVTPSALNAEDQSAVRDAVAQAVALDPARGDSIGFETGPVEFSQIPRQIGAPAPSSPASAAPQLLPPAGSREVAGVGFASWLGLGAALLVGLALLRRARRRRNALADDEHEAFAAKLRRQLNLAEAPDAAA